jgi:hypothetical protein
MLKTHSNYLQLTTLGLAGMLLSGAGNSRVDEKICAPLIED